MNAGSPFTESAALIPAINPAKAIFYNPEQVPFRFTPNIQTLLGPIATEGVFACAMMAISRCLTEPRHELEQQLSIFVRDEMIFSLEPVPQDKSQELRYTKNADFTDEVAEEYLNRLPSTKEMFDDLINADRSKFLRVTGSVT